MYTIFSGLNSCSELRAPNLLRTEVVELTRTVTCNISLRAFEFVLLLALHCVGQCIGGGFLSARSKGYSSLPPQLLQQNTLMHWLATATATLHTPGALFSSTAHTKLYTIRGCNFPSSRHATVNCIVKIPPLSLSFRTLPELHISCHCSLLDIWLATRAIS